MKHLKHVEIIKQESEATERNAMYIIPTDSNFCKVIFVSTSGQKRSLGFTIPPNIALTDYYDVNGNLTEEGTVYFKTQVNTLINNERNLRELGDANLAESYTGVAENVDALIAWKNALTGNDEDEIVNTLTELIAIMQNMPEGTDIYSVLASKVNVTDIVNTLSSSLTNVPLSAYQGQVLNSLITALQTSYDSISDRFYNQDFTLRIDEDGINSNVSIYEQDFMDEEVVLAFEPVQILGVYVDGLKIKDSDYTLTMPQTITFSIETEGKYINIQYRHLITT